MESLWEQTSGHTGFGHLEQDAKTDVLIIGGGIAGVLCAYLLHQAGVLYLLLEAETIGGGITKNTTAKITSQHGLIYDKLIRKFGAGQAKQYLDANEAALQKYRELCRGMDCDFEEKTAYVYSLNDRRKIERELDALEKLGVPGEFTDRLPLPFPVAGAVRYPNQAQFHPLKWIAAISKSLHICEHTPVRELVGTTAITGYGKVTANKIIVATHFPFLNKHGSFFAKLYQHRSYVIALENAPNVDGMYVDEAQTGMSFRNYKNLLLVGGGDHRTGKQGGAWQELRDFAQRHYPKAAETSHWATQDCMSLDGVPYIGHRFQQGGNDLRHGVGHGPVRSCPREAEPLCRGVFPLQNDSSPPIGGQWLRGRGQPPDPFRQALSPSRLRVEMEPAGAHVGLPLPRLPFYRGGQVDRQPGNGESEKVVPPNETAPSVFPV